MRPVCNSALVGCAVVLFRFSGEFILGSGPFGDLAGRLYNFHYIGRVSVFGPGNIPETPPSSYSANRQILGHVSSLVGRQTTR